MPNLLLILANNSELNPYYPYFIQFYQSYNCYYLTEQHLDSPSEITTNLHHLPLKETILNYKGINGLIELYQIDILVYFYLDSERPLDKPNETFQCPSVCHYFTRNMTPTNKAISFLRCFDQLLVENPSLQVMLNPYLHNKINCIPLPLINSYHLVNQVNSKSNQLDLRSMYPNKLLIYSDLVEHDISGQLDILMRLLASLDTDCQLVINNNGLHVDPTTLNNLITVYSLDETQLVLIEADDYILPQVNIYLQLHSQAITASRLMWIQSLAIPVVALGTHLNRDFVINGIAITPNRQAYNRYSGGLQPVVDIPQVIEALKIVRERDHARVVMATTLARSYCLCIENPANYLASYNPVLEGLLKPTSHPALKILDLKQKGESLQLVTLNRETAKKNGFIYEYTKFSLDSDSESSYYRLILDSFIDCDLIIVLGESDVLANIPVKTVYGLVNNLLDSKSMVANYDCNNFRDCYLLKKTDFLVSYLDRTINKLEESPSFRDMVSYNLDPDCFSKKLLREDNYLSMWSVIYNVSACDPNELDSILETDELTAFRFPFRSHNFKIKELTCEIHLDAMATGIYNNLSCQWNFIGGKLEIYYRSPQNDIINVSLTIPRRDILR